MLLELHLESMIFTVGTNASPAGQKTEFRPKSVLSPAICGRTAMKYSTQVKPISYLKSHTAEIVSRLNETREPMLITQNGEAKLVVMDVQSYEEQEQTIALLQILAHGRHEIEAGHVVSAADAFAHIEAMDDADEG